MARLGAYLGSDPCADASGRGVSANGFGGVAAAVVVFEVAVVAFEVAFETDL